MSAEIRHLSGTGKPLFVLAKINGNTRNPVDPERTGALAAAARKQSQNTCASG